MDFAELLLVNAGVAASSMFVMWLLSVWRSDASIVDPFWGAGFVLIGWVTASLGDSLNGRSWLALMLVSVWGLRLSLYLLKRNWGEGEDRRYAKMREKHGDRFWWVSLFTVFLLQGLIMWVVSIPVQVAVAWQSGPLGWIDGAAAAVWLVGIVFEAGGDYQMARFKADPDNEGEVMNRGLWRYTRHPNYFGDFCVWWGHYLVAVAAGGWWTIFSPLVMSVLLMKVSGVTLLESDMEERRPNYRQYKERTNAFFPGPPSDA